MDVDWAGQRLGNLELLRRLGSGGMGDVWLARQEGLDRRVAVKLLPRTTDRRSIERLRREAQALARIRHPHVVPVHEVGEHDGVHYYVMDLVDGRSLEAVLADGRLAWRRAAAIARQLAEALAAAHDQGVVHRDVKPANVVLADEGDHATLVDFGLALAEAAPTLTQSGDVLGTPFYMAPEQARGNASHADARTDVWGAGATLYEMITGRKPFGDEHWLVVQMAVLENAPVPPRRLEPDCPPDLETIVLRCLEKDPARRYPTARELADDLARCLADEPIRARPPPARVDPIQAHVRRRRLAWRAGAAVALLAAIGGVAWRLERRGEAEARDREAAEAAELVRIARALAERGEAAEAWTRLREVELRFPRTPAAVGASWAMVDLVRRGQGEDDVLAQEAPLARLLEADPPAGDRARARWRLGRIHDKHGFFADARAHYAAAAEGGALPAAELEDARFGLAWAGWLGRRAEAAVAARVIGAGDLDGDGRDEVLAYDPRGLAALGLRGGRLEVVRRWELPGPAAGARPAAPPRLADLDGDGRPELVAALGDRCVVDDLAGPAVRRVLSLERCDRIAPGDLDGDGRPELVVARGRPRAGLWLVRVGPDGSVNELLLDDLAADETSATGLDLADLDGDGRAELIYAGGAWTRYDVRVARLDGDALRPVARGRFGAIDGLEAIDGPDGRRAIFAVKSHTAANHHLFEDDPYLGPSGPMLLRLAGDRLERTWLDPLVPAAGPDRPLHAAARSRRTPLGPLSAVASADGTLVHLYVGRPGGDPRRRDLRRSGAGDLDGGLAIADLDGDGAGELVLGGARVVAHGIGPEASAPRRERPRTGADWLEAARRHRAARETDLALEAGRAAAAHGADPAAVAFEEGACHAQAERWELALARFRNARTAGRRDAALWRATLEAAEAIADWEAALEAARALGDTARTAALEQLRASRTVFLQDFAEPWRPGWRVEQPLACRGPTPDGAVGLTLLPGDRALALPIEWDGSSLEVSAVIALRDAQHDKGLGIELVREDGRRVGLGIVVGTAGGGAPSLHADLHTPERVPGPPRRVDWSVFPERVALALAYVAHTGRWQVTLRDLGGTLLARTSARAAERPAAGRHAIRLIGPEAPHLAASIVDAYRIEVRAAGALAVVPAAASDPPPRCARDLAPPGATSPLHRAFALAAGGRIDAAARELAAWRAAAPAELEAGLVRLALLDEPLASSIAVAGRLVPARDWGVLLRRLAHRQHVAAGQTRWREAAIALRRATALAPDDAHAWYLLGYCRYRLGDLAAARDALERAAALEPALERSYPAQGGPAILLARIAARERDAAAAARHLAEAARLGGDLDLARHDRALRDLLGDRLHRLAGAPP